LQRLYGNRAMFVRKGANTVSHWRNKDFGLAFPLRGSCNLLYFDSCEITLFARATYGS
jgi:hypothetical protein